MTNTVHDRFLKFKARADERHLGVYRYNESEYLNSRSILNIFCTIHNAYFKQSARAHINGSGCKKCVAENRCTHRRFDGTDEFVRAMVEKFGIGTFTYEKTVYNSMKSPVTVTCPIHGDITHTPDSFLNGNGGCRKCGYKKSGRSNTMSLDSFILKSIEKFGKKYDFSDSIYIKSTRPIHFICPIHGDVTMTPHDHLSSTTGCPKCGKESMAVTQMLSPDEIISIGNSRYNGKYTYLTDTYRGYQIPMGIICPIHGLFSQSFDSHIHNNGCPKCNNRESTGEKKIFEYVSSIVGYENVVRNYVGLFGDNREIDIYVPSHNIGIEFDGLEWHSEKRGKDIGYHLRKTEDAMEKGVLLIHVFEDEWIEHKDLVLDRICHYLGGDSEKIKINAEDISVRKIGRDIAKDFLDRYNMQGYSPSSIRLGAYCNSSIVAVMTFRNVGCNVFYLNRYSTDIRYSLYNVGQKLIGYFISEYAPSEIKAFSDRRWNPKNDIILEMLGFTLDSVSKPDYMYVNGKKRVKKQFLGKEIIDRKRERGIVITEKQIATELRINRIWDCGKLKYIWRKK